LPGTPQLHDVVRIVRSAQEISLSGVISEPRGG
jgi:hypothetical protein